MVWIRRSLPVIAAGAKLGCAALVAGSLLLTDIVAFAQNVNCGRVESLLLAIERTPEFRNLGRHQSDLRAAEGQVRAAETAFARGGCQQQVSAGWQMGRECQNAARVIAGGRADLARLSQQVRDGQSLAQQRQALLTDRARLNCGQSGVTFGQQGPGLGPPQRRSLLEELFGGGPAPAYEGYGIIEEPYRDPWSTGATRRSVCVRTCDGYYWPISFSTTEHYLYDDAGACAQQCPGAEVQLFSYRNPGEEAEDMVSLSGQPYRSMPYAFRYRQDYNPACSCRQQTPQGIVVLGGDGPQSRAVIDLGTGSFPLPQGDPRRRVEALVAGTPQVPLPRPRPRADGGTPEVPVRDAGLRIVSVGEREVRIVGPRTPFAPEEAE